MTLEPIPQFDLYAELEVSQGASAPTIDAAWRSLMKRNHPDVATTQSPERTVRLNIAHDWLVDPARRARYDAAEPRRSRRLRRHQLRARHPRAGPERLGRRSNPKSFVRRR